MHKLILVCGDIHFYSKIVYEEVCLRTRMIHLHGNDVLPVLVNCRYSTLLGLDFSVLSQCWASGLYRFLSYYDLLQLGIALKLLEVCCLTVWFDIYITASIHVLPRQWQDWSFEAWCCERDNDGSSVTWHLQMFSPCLPQRLFHKLPNPYTLFALCLILDLFF